MMIKTLRGAFVAVGLALPVGADVPLRIEATFTAWVQDVGAQSAVATLWHDGVHQHDLSFGDTYGDTGVELASLSKAVTAICAVTLIREGRWTRTTSSYDVLGQGAKGLTVQGLMTHSAGVLPDQTQGLRAMLAMRSADLPARVAQRAVKRVPQEGTPGTFAYNNENYAILAAMIAAETGMPYTQACHERVLTPAGIADAAPSEQTKGFLPWGGWRMSVHEYAQLLNWAYGPGGIIGGHVASLPAHRLGTGPVSYGVGMFQRPIGMGYSFWHFGAWCMPLQLNVGSFALHRPDGWSLVAAYDICANDAQMHALNSTLNVAFEAERAE